MAAMKPRTGDGPMEAVKEGRLVYVEDRYRYVTSHHAAEALEAIAKAVYPELWQ